MTSAPSPGWPERFRGVACCTTSRTKSQSAVHGVSINPGATALTRISGPTTLASRTVMWLRAALLAAYGMEDPVGRTPATEATLTMEPCDALSAGTAAPAMG